MKLIRIICTCGKEMKTTQSSRAPFHTPVDVYNCEKCGKVLNVQEV